MTVTVAAPQSTSVPFCVVDITPEARAAAVRALTGGWVTTGPEVAAFESEFAALVGARHAVAVSSCTAGLQLALRALELPRRACAHAVDDLRRCGARDSPGWVATGPR